MLRFDVEYSRTLDELMIGGFPARLKMLRSCLFASFDAHLDLAFMSLKDNTRRRESNSRLPRTACTYLYTLYMDYY